MSTLKNDFPPSVKRFWQFEHPYSYCGRNGSVDLHHIKKRISNSIFNSIPLTRREHDAGDRHSVENEKKYLRWTFSFVMRKFQESTCVYGMRPTDYEFLAKLVCSGIITDKEVADLEKTLNQ